MSMSVCRRAKEKRLKKDAGRQRWSPYFSRGKRGGGSDDNDPLDDMSKDSIDGYGSEYCATVPLNINMLTCIRSDSNPDFMRCMFKINMSGSVC